MRSGVNLQTLSPQPDSRSHLHFALTANHCDPAVICQGRVVDGPLYPRIIWLLMVGHGQISALYPSLPVLTHAKGNGAVRPVRDGRQLRARRRHTRILLLRASEGHARSSQSRLSAKQLAPREKTLREEVERRSRMSKSQQLLEELLLRKLLSFFFLPSTCPTGMFHAQKGNRSRCKRLYKCRLRKQAEFALRDSSQDLIKETLMEKKRRSRVWVPILDKHITLKGQREKVPGG